jgi:hypothetical protein
VTEKREPCLTAVIFRNVDLLLVTFSYVKMQLKCWEFGQEVNKR